MHVAMRWIPLALTLSRAAASPCLAVLLVHHHFRASLALVLVAGLTDWFDGFAARKLGVSGRLGVVLDPMADKLLLVTLFFSLAYIGLIPGAMLALVMGRDLVIVVGAALLRLLRNHRRFIPSASGKVSTFFQIVLVLLVLANAAVPARPFALLATVALWLSVIFTSLSGIEYVRRGIRMAHYRNDDPTATLSERASEKTPLN